MSDLFSALNSAASALRAFQTALDVTQNNVSNSQTVGYAKQTATFDSLSFSTSSGLSGGVESAAPQDSRNQYAESAVRRQQSLLGSSSQLSTSLDPIEQVFSVASGSGGVSDSIDALFSSFSAWSANPSDASTQQTVLNAASQVAVVFQQSASQLNGIRSAVDGDLKTSVAQINQLGATIAKLNASKQSNNTPDPGLDAQLNSALEQLSQYADVQTLTASDGTTTVLLGGQVPLVTGNQVHQIGLQYSPSSSAANPSAPPDATLVDENGADITQKIPDGQIGALLSVRNQILPRLIGGPNETGDLNTLASQLASTVNGVFTAAGGKPLFTYDQTSAVDAAATLSVTSGLHTQDLVAADPGPPPVSNGVPLKLSGLGTAPNAGLQGSTFSQFYGSTASWIGNQLSQAQTASAAQTQSVAQAQSLRQNLSGVSLDQEAMSLMELQRSYQAASRMVSVIDTLTQSVIDMIQ